MPNQDGCANLQPLPTPPCDLAAFTVKISTEGGDRVVHISGELDTATRSVVHRACLDGGNVAVVIEMADMTFMDCCGYGGLVAARHELQELGGTLTLRNQVGQPARLLSLLAVLEARPMTSISQGCS